MSCVFPCVLARTPRKWLAMKLLHAHRQVRSAGLPVVTCVVVSASDRSTVPQFEMTLTWQKQKMCVSQKVSVLQGLLCYTELCRTLNTVRNHFCLMWLLSNVQYWIKLVNGLPCNLTVQTLTRYAHLTSQEYVWCLFLKKCQIDTFLHAKKRKKEKEKTLATTSSIAAAAVLFHLQNLSDLCWCYNKWRWTELCFLLLVLTVLKT